MICENCKKEHDGTYGSGRFCSNKCARSFSTKKDNSKELKIIKCINCGNSFLINKRASLLCKCENCKKQTYKKCLICGSLYKDGYQCSNEFCQNKSIKQFQLLIKYYGFDKNKLGTSEVEIEFNRIRNLLYDLYWNKNMSGADIKKYFNYTKKRSIIQNTFKYLGIPIRNFKQSTSNAILNGKILYENNSNNYKHQKYITWNNKEVYLRSSYELDYAKQLDEQKIDYEVESLRIKYWDSQKQEYRIAIPDFYISKNNLIIEIKSSWTTNYQELKDKENEYKKQGYNYKLIFEHNEYNSIDDIDLVKYRINNNQIIRNRKYKQKDGYHWIYKDNIQLKCNKNEIDSYIKEGWIIGRLYNKK